MSDDLKAVLAIALPVGALLVGAMVIYGPGAKIEGADLRGRRWNRQRGFLGGGAEDLSTLTPSEINRRLDRLDKLSSKLSNELIAAGRGYEKPSETRQKSDPLALRHNALDAEHDALHREISRRYGPGAPSRLPTRQRKTIGKRPY